jgi:hypothetical protein
MKPSSVVEHRESSTIRHLAFSALGGVACFALAILALHVVQPDLSALDEAMSYYVHGAYGWLMTVALLAIGLGSLALTIALAQAARRPRTRSGVIFLGAWSLCALLGGIFPADPPGNWAQPPSIAGAIHGVAALVGLVAFPLAAILLSRGVGGITMALAIASAVGLLVFLASLSPALVTSGPPVLLGLTERIMLAAYALWIATASMGLLGEAATQSSTPR